MDHKTDTDLFNHMLNQGLNGPNPIKVINLLKKKSHLVAGDNYGSVMNWYELEYEQNGKIHKVNVVNKILPEDTARRDAFVKLHIFDKEIWVYECVFPQMEKLMAANNVKGEIFWAKCYGFRKSDCVLLHDLTDVGYKMAQRNTLLDVNHALLVLRSLAKIHIMSTYLISKKIIDKSDPQLLSIHARRSSLMESIIKSGVKTLVSSIRTHWEPHWHPVADKIENKLKNASEVLYNLCLVAADDLLALNHGDCWRNNMLFKYSDDDQPISVRFVDFQAANYGSVCWDLTNFMYSSVNPDTRRENLHLFLTEYIKSAELTKQNLHLDDSIVVIPSVEDFRKSMDRLLIFGLIFSCTMLPLTLAKPGDTFDFSGILEKKDGEETSGHKSSLFEYPEVIGFLKRDVKYYHELGILD